MGRRKIAIEKIDNKEKRAVTFTKRRQGLFKKADAACDMYGSQIAIVVFSPASGKPFVHGPVDSLIDRFLASSSNPNASSTSTDVLVDGNCAGKRKRSRGDDDEDIDEFVKEGDDEEEEADDD